jgi:hypothetical protein
MVRRIGGRCWGQQVSRGSLSRPLCCAALLLGDRRDGRERRCRDRAQQAPPRERLRPQPRGARRAHASMRLGRRPPTCSDGESASTSACDRVRLLVQRTLVGLHRALGLSDLALPLAPLGLGRCLAGSVPRLCCCHLEFAVTFVEQRVGPPSRLDVHPQQITQPRHPPFGLGAADPSRAVFAVDLCRLTASALHQRVEARGHALDQHAVVAQIREEPVHRRIEVRGELPRHGVDKRTAARPRREQRR